MNKTVTTQKQQAGKTTVVYIAALALVAIAGLGGGYYLWSTQHTQLKLLHEYVGQVESQLGIKTDAVKEFRNSLSKLTAEAQSQDVILNDHMRALEDELKATKSRLRRLENNIASESWLLSEVEYLLKMADQRILIKEDVRGALVLMRQAEKLIREMNADDQGLMNVRVAIAKDIASMEMYRNIDVPGTYAELSALGIMIEKLPLVPTQMPAEADKAEEGSTLAKVNDAFAGYITIRKHNTDELKALLSPEQRLNLRDSLRLTQDQAQTALLRGDQRTYDDSMSRLRRMLLKYFISTDTQTQQALRRIESLARVQVEFDLPSIAISQQELKRYLSDRMRRLN
jgi:uroporphyrin-III C-methyltransferase